MSGVNDVDVSVFQRKRVGVLGDFYLDEYIYGRVLGVSPEMPVLRVTEETRRRTPGAAGNVAANVAGLRAHVKALGVIGADREGDSLTSQLRDRGIDVSSLFQMHDRVTGTFSRIVVRSPDGAEHHQLRLDRENQRPLTAGVRTKLVDAVVSGLQDLDVLFLADYDETRARCGLLDGDTIATVVAAARSRGVLLAGISRHHLAEFTGVDYLFCNLAEARTLGLRAEDQLTDWAVATRRDLEAHCLVVTLGASGMLCSDRDGVLEIPALAARVVDTCGAGDSLAATFVLACASGASMKTAATLAAAAASFVVARPGTVAVSAEALAVPEGNGASQRSKFTTIDDLVSLLRPARESTRIVFTNGCFDLFHSGHVSLLRSAKSLGDLLIVGINSDRSTRLNKGEGRPVLPEHDRVLILTALECVDYVVVFDELTPIRLIRQLKPDVLVKGGDYRSDEVVGRDIVQAAGGEVVVLPRQAAWDTKTLIQSVRAASDGTRSG